MPPKLDFELLLSVAEHVKEHINLIRGSNLSVVNAIKSERLAILNLAKTCKALNHIIAPLLYRECITENFESLAAGFGTNNGFEMTRRLHLYHRGHHVDSAYRDLFTTGWDDLRVKKRPNDFLAILDLDSVFSECRALVKEGIRLRQFLTEGVPVLPELQIVSMAGLGDNAYNRLDAPSLDLWCRNDVQQDFKILALALIDIPTVQHYCQAVNHGPLAIPSIVFEPRSLLQTFTHHTRCTPLFTPFPAYQLERAPPIILGAVNRYYDELPSYIPYPWASDSSLPVLFLVPPILAMLKRPTSSADPVTGNPVVLSVDDKADPYKDTAIEIYNLFRVVHRSNFDDNTAQPIDPAKEHRDIVPKNLDFCQALLDRYLPENWKGKVWFKNREEAPPCAACGFDIEEHFNAAILHLQSHIGGDIGN